MLCLGKAESSVHILLHCEFAVQVCYGWGVPVACPYFDNSP
jgi:hypothetical protein